MFDGMDGVESDVPETVSVLLEFVIGAPPLPEEFANPTRETGKL
jgi:hypothetical protein